MLVATKAPPFAAYKNIVLGAVGSWDVVSNVLVSWVPLLLVTAGCSSHSPVGLWNIGIEGQIILGAIFTTWALRLLQKRHASRPSSSRLASWRAWWAARSGPLLAGALKTFGGVNEIFGGLGLNFVATALNLWLIFGPWKRPGVASMSGTVPFPTALWLPTLTAQSRLSPSALVIAIVGHPDGLLPDPGARISGSG